LSYSKLTDLPFKTSYRDRVVWFDERVVERTMKIVDERYASKFKPCVGVAHLQRERERERERDIGQKAE